MMTRLPSILRVLTLGLTLGIVVHASPAAEPDRPAVAPGLIGRYFAPAEGAEPRCVRVDPGVAFDWTDGTPDDRLPAGGFRVVWEGLLRVQQRGQYGFSAQAQGHVQIWIQGRNAYPPKPGETLSTLTLDAGDWPLRVAYDAPAARAKIHLIWQSTAFPAEVINPRYLGHLTAAEAPVAGQLAHERGRSVVERYGCARCHPITGVDRSRKPGLPMPHVGQMNAQWVVRWIRNPQSVRPGTRMGAPGGTPQEIDQMIANLLGLVALPEVCAISDPRWQCGASPDPLDSLDRAKFDELAGAGRRRFYELGCSACHAPETPQDIDPTRGPTLADLGSKWSRAYMRQLMLDPVGRHPTGGMPAYKLDAIDLDRLVAYMSTFTLPEPPGAPAIQTPLVPARFVIPAGKSALDPTVFAEAKLPIRKRLCYACHSPENTPVDGPVLDPAKAQWDRGCLRLDRSASYAPQFTLTPDDRRAVIAFLAGRPAKAVALASGEAAQRMMAERLSCFACHRRDGAGAETLTRTLAHYLNGDPLLKAGPMTPPDLSGVGVRLVGPWMDKVLAGKASSNRPWLTLKMPDFGLSEAERNRFAARLACADQIPDIQDPASRTLPDDIPFAGTALIGSRGFNCVNCHFVGVSDYREGKSAPDFTMAAQRINRAWFHRWISNPARILPGVTMPAFQTPVKGVAGDDLSLQKEILWRFLQRSAVNKP